MHLEQKTWWHVLIATGARRMSEQISHLRLASRSFRKASPPPSQSEGSLTSPKSMCHFGTGSVNEEAEADTEAEAEELPAAPAEGAIEIRRAVLAD